MPAVSFEVQLCVLSALTAGSYLYSGPSLILAFTAVLIALCSVRRFRSRGVQILLAMLLVFVSVTGAERVPRNAGESSIELLQRCADRLTHGGDGDDADPAESGLRGCELVGAPAPDVPSAAGGDEARSLLRGRWGLVVGDSRSRMVFSALLSLVNGSLPALGWPTHRVPNGSTCEAHVLPSQQTGAFPERVGREYWGWYNPACMERWKGPCHDDKRGRNLYDTCALDFELPSHRIRLSFIWHSYSGPGYPLFRELMQTRIGRMTHAAGRGPDLVLGSAATWDMIFTQRTADCCCGVVDLFLRSLAINVSFSATAAGTAAVAAGHGRRQRARRPLLVLYGFFGCPACTRPAAALGQLRSASRTVACVNAPAAPNLRNLTAKTQRCARGVAAANTAVYLDVAPLVAASDPLSVSSPCLNNHAFGSGAEAHAAALLGLARFAALPPAELDHTDGAALWPAWRDVGNALHCARGEACTSWHVRGALSRQNATRRARPAAARF